MKQFAFVSVLTKLLRVQLLLSPPKKGNVFPKCPAATMTDLQAFVPQVLCSCEIWHDNEWFSNIKSPVPVGPFSATTCLLFHLSK